MTHSSLVAEQFRNWARTAAVVLDSAKRVVACVVEVRSDSVVEGTVKRLSCWAAWLAGNSAGRSRMWLHACIVFEMLEEGSAAEDSAADIAAYSVGRVAVAVEDTGHERIEAVLEVGL